MPKRQQNDALRAATRKDSRRKSQGFRVLKWQQKDVSRAPVRKIDNNSAKLADIVTQKTNIQEIGILGQYTKMLQHPQLKNNSSAQIG